MLGNINIEAGESTYSQSSKSNSRNLGGSVGTNGLSANIGFNESQSSFDQTSFANSQISAINGNLNINTKQDLKIFGANLLSKNVNLNIGNNFLLKSRQNLSESDSYNIGASIGLSGDSSGVNGGSLGLNLGNGYSNKAMVEDISSIIGNNSVNINVANDTNIASALIANQNKEGIDLGNLNIKTKSLTYSDLNNFSVSNSNQLSTNLQAGYNPNNPTQNGNLAIKLNMQGSESSSTIKATIGKGNITISEILNDESKIANLNRDINNIEQNKKNIITSDFDSEIKIDLRLIASVGNLMIGDTDKATANWNSYATQTVDGSKLTSDILFGTNLSKLNPRQTSPDQKLSSKDAIPLTLPWFSRYVNENNTVVKTETSKDGTAEIKTTNYPAPNLLPGFGNEPIMGIAHETCTNSICYYLGSDQAPTFKAVHKIFPGVDSGSAFHDADNYSNSLTTAATIPLYFAISYIGAVGTFFDAPNWKQNFVDPKTNIFVKPQTETMQQLSN